jgi:hypothetical protein
MKHTYIEIIDNNETVGILRSDGASIPLDPGNSDYQAYLAEQSTPMVTDEANPL